MKVKDLTVQPLDLTWHSLEAEDVLAGLDVSLDGLDPRIVGERLTHWGANQIQERPPVSPWRLLAKQFASPFVWLLLAAAILAFSVSFLPGQEGRRITGFFILGIVAISVGLGFFEEVRSNRELDALHELLAERAFVKRSGQLLSVDAKEIVPGDLLVLKQGQKVPADARLLESHDLRVDESTLTGESLGVQKETSPVPVDAPLAERKSMVYASTFLTHGSGVAVVVATGMRTEVGKIASSLRLIQDRPSPFQREVQRMARQMTWLVAGLVLFIVPFLLFVLHDPWVDVALNTLSLAVATVPESLPIVLTFALSLGARQMARRKAVVRQLSVVESLGSVDIICTDKTGTLTMNQMSLQRFWAGNRAWEPDKDTLSNVARQALVAGILCNEAVLPANGSTPIGDPVDSAFLEAAHRFGLEAKVERSIAPVVRILPFSAERKRMTTLHQTGAGVVAFMKGAPGVVLERCSAIAQEEGTLPLDPPRFAILRELADSWQADGYYLLAVARKDNVDPKNPVEGEEGMTFLGLVGMIDPPRPEAAMAISRAREAGIRVVMITGDNLRTAQAIARQLGIGEEGLQAGELEGASLMQIGERLQGVDIVARATPQTKQQVLEALQAKGHFVAMTGDGVNDATALKQADVGIAMGMRGTDIAKESADMVLLDDRFDTIVAAVEEGRRIFDNIRKFTNYLLSTSLGAVLMVLLLSVAGYFPLSAQMLLWVNVITDLIPASALAADPVVPQIMKRRPRHRSEPILNRAIYATIAGSIFRTLIAYSLIFWLGLLWGGIAYARTMLFTSIVLHAFTRVMVVRQLDSLTLWSNRALLWSYAVAVGLQLLALYTPLRVLFGAVALDWRAWALMIPVTAGSSLAGIAMTRWILRKIPLWEQEKPAAPIARAGPPH